MRMYLISDDMDSLAGMRLAGVKGECVESAQEFLEAFTEAVHDSNIGILLITRTLWDEFENVIGAYRMNERPLIVPLPR